MTEEQWSTRRTAFGSAAADYASGRPHYPREALEWGLPDGAREVLDLGAGTGILTADLLDLGLDVTAVEPLPEMRALIPPSARSVDGSAEAIQRNDNSVDAVFAGQAWHWFDPSRAVAEAHRVLRPGGALVVMWNLLDTSDPLARTIADIVEAEERADAMLAVDPEPPFIAPDQFSAPEQLVVPHVQGYDPARIVEFALSRSQTILLAPTDRDALIGRLRAAVPNEPFAVNWICEAWRATAH